MNIFQNYDINYTAIFSIVPCLLLSIWLILATRKKKKIDPPAKIEGVKFTPDQIRWIHLITEQTLFKNTPLKNFVIHPKIIVSAMWAINGLYRNEKPKYKIFNPPNNYAVMKTE